MSYPLRYVISGAFILAIAAMMAVSAFTPAPRAGAAFYTATIIGSATTTASFAVTTSARVLATTTSITDPTNSYNRVYASICNPNANPVVLNLDSDKAANLNGAATTIIAAAAGYSACYEIKDINTYSGAITASSTNQTSTTIFVKDYVVH